MLKKLFEPTSSSQKDTEPVQPPEEDIASIPPLEEAVDLASAMEEAPAPDLPAEEVVADPLPEERIDSASSSAEDINAVRELILALHPTIVPELIGGDSVSALIASIASAQEAYSRIVTGVRIPAGGNPPVAFDADSLTAFDKIRRGLATRPPRSEAR